MFEGNNSLRKRARRGELDKWVFRKVFLFADIIFVFMEASSWKTSKEEML